jgi:PAS domain S-box-containing protein
LGVKAAPAFAPRREQPMMWLWTDRPRATYLALFFGAYLGGCGLAAVLGIVPGTNIAIWPPGGMFMATLIVAPRKTWPWYIAVGCGAELLGQIIWYHSPLDAGFIMYLGNALEAAAGACLVNRASGRSARLDTLRDVVAFVVIGAGFAPLISATVGAATLSWFHIRSQTFAEAWPLWWIGDATGILIVTPLALAFLRTWRSETRWSPARWVEAGVLGLILLAVAAFSLSGPLPFAYLIMPVLLWAAVRFEFRGAVIALTILALITAAFTLSGAGQFAGDSASQREKLIMLQLFLAISALSALIVAAISRQHQLATMTLRQSNEALQARERELSHLVNMAPSHVWRLKPDGEPTFFNQRMIDFIGTDAVNASKPGLSRLDALMQTIVHPDDYPSFNKALGRSLATGATFAERYRLRRADGVYRWMSSQAEPMRDGAGRVLEWYGLCHDIDDQMRLYREVEDREAKIRRLVDSDIIGIVIWDLDGTLIDANDAFLRMLQYDRDDLKAGLNWLAMTPPDWQEVHAREEAAELAATGKMQAREKEYFRKDGSRVPILIGGACFEGQSNQGVAFILDLTERKRAEAAVRERERELSLLVEMVPVNIGRMAPDGEPTFFSQRTLESIGIEHTGALDKAGMTRLSAMLSARVHPDDAPRMREVMRHSLETGEPYMIRYRRLRADGVYRWMDGRANPLRDEHGEIVQWYAATLDVDDQVRAEDALRESERALWQLVETLPIMIDCAAPNGEPRYRSRQLREFLGYELTELDGTGKSRLAGTLDAGVHPDDVAGVKELYAHSLATGEPYGRRHRLRRFDGQYIWVDTRAAPMRDANGDIIQWNVTCLDIDAEVRAQEELRLAQERLARASQAASLAELSASIAHEVNQPLAAVVANSHACQRWLTADPPNLERAQTTIERIIRDANGAAEVVSRIRALFKQNVRARDGSSLALIIADAKRWVSDLATRHGVLLDAQVEQGVPTVSIDQVQIQQVLINLMRNAVEAMAANSKPRSLRVRASAGGGEVRIAVHDTGPGLENAEKIFDPFFTTKESGMGMGLAVSRSIVESHGGRLWAEQNSDGGASFIFTLPIQTPASP